MHILKHFQSSVKESLFDLFLFYASTASKCISVASQGKTDLKVYLMLHFYMNWDIDFETNAYEMD